MHLPKSIVQKRAMASFIQWNECHDSLCSRESTSYQKDLLHYDNTGGKITESLESVVLQRALDLALIVGLGL